MGEKDSNVLLVPSLGCAYITAGKPYYALQSSHLGVWGAYTDVGDFIVIRMGKKCPHTKGMWSDCTPSSPEELEMYKMLYPEFPWDSLSIRGLL